mmetsp:Transcript_64319/g.153429  ORF Transcript_64319/g.153429 Transcript_64319/m.153429 type:complete len:203 (-) Transcript_64319:419-1027(-)
MCERRVVRQGPGNRAASSRRNRIVLEVQHRQCCVVSQRLCCLVSASIVQVAVRAVKLPQRAVPLESIVVHFRLDVAKASNLQLFQHVFVLLPRRRELPPGCWIVVDEVWIARLREDAVFSVQLFQVRAVHLVDLFELLAQVLQLLPRVLHLCPGFLGVWGHSEGHGQLAEALIFYRVVPHVQHLQGGIVEHGCCNLPSVPLR